MFSSIFTLLLIFLVTRESNAKVATLRGLITELPSNPPSTSLDWLLGIHEDPPTAAPVLGGGGHGQQITDPSEFDEEGDSNLNDDEPTGDDEDEILGGDGVDEKVAGMDEDIDGGDEDEGMDVNQPPDDETEAPTSAFGNDDTDDTDDVGNTDDVNYIDDIGYTDAPSSSGMNPSPDDIPSPTLSPTTMWRAPTYVTPPTAKPVVYVATDDDPLQQEDESIAETEEQEDTQTGGIGDSLYFDHAESIEEMEHDSNVAIALGVCLGLGLCLTIITAHQMMDHPDGCCASVCRIIVACQCAITRCVCFPCRLMCGCTGKGRNNHSGYSRNQYSSDLELT